MLTRVKTHTHIPISSIDLGDRQRKEYSEIPELAEQITKAGGLINPITVQEHPDGKSPFKYLLLCGGRRLSAHQFMKLTEIEANIWPSSISPIEKEIIELMENIARSNLSYIEELDALRHIHDLQVRIAAEDGQIHTIKDTAQLVGKAISTVSENLKLQQAMQGNPTLAKAKNLSDAKKQLRVIEENIIIQEISRRAQKKKAVSGIDKIRKDLGQAFLVGNCLEYLKKLPDSSVQFADIDPPYSVDFVGNVNTHPTANRQALDEFVQPSPEQMNIDLLTVLKETYRVLTPDSWAVLWYDINTYQTISDIVEESGFKRGPAPGIWTKYKAARNSHPSIRLCRDYEPFFYLSKGDPQLSMQSHSSIYTHQPIMGESGHPASKPISLMEEILKTFCIPSTRILVPYLGSGNTIIAAANLNMSAFGFDLSETYKNKFISRVQQWNPPEKKEISHE